MFVKAVNNHQKETSGTVSMQEFKKLWEILVTMAQGPIWIKIFPDVIAKK